MIFEATDLYYLPNLTNIRECGYFCRYFCKYKKQLLYFLMTEGFQTSYSITILRTDISSSRTKPAGLDFWSYYKYDKYVIELVLRRILISHSTYTGDIQTIFRAVYLLKIGKKNEKKSKKVIWSVDRVTKGRKESKWTYLKVCYRRTRTISSGHTRTDDLETSNDLGPLGKKGMI